MSPAPPQASAEPPSRPSPSRKQANAEAAIVKLAEEVGDSRSTFNALEIDLGKKASVDAFVSNLVEQDIQLDVLLNNAGINGFAEAKKTKEGRDRILNVNYTHTRYLSEQMLEHNRIKENSKIICVGSLAGKIGGYKVNPPVYERLLTWQSWGYKELEDFLKDVLADHEDPESDRAKQWHPMFYVTTKLFLNLWVSVFSKDPRVTAKGIQVYALCPGFCETEMMVGSE